jgi:hypothetical protein
MAVDGNYSSQRSGFNFMKKIKSKTVISRWIFAAFLMTSASVGFAESQKKSAATNQEKPDALLAAAMKNMETGVWSVNGTVTAKKPIKMRGLLSGKDFDLTMEPGAKPDVPMRGIMIKDKAWVCSDGETWHAGNPNDRVFYNWAHTPIMRDPQLPSFEKVGAEERNGRSMTHLRLKVPEKDINPKELPQYWIVLDSQGKAQYIGHAEMPLFSQASNSVLYSSLDYAPSKDRIAPPPLGSALDDQVHGFNDIEQHKFDWKGKILRVSVSPKLLQSEQIAEDTYRALLKDTTPSSAYGMVEFPHDALVKLGFLKKTVSGAHGWQELEKMGVLGRTEGEPVSFYVQVIPIGKQPAARTVAVGATLNREADGSISYTWGGSLSQLSDQLNKSADTDEERSAADSTNNHASEGTTVSLLEGKLKFELPADFSRDPDDPKDPKTVARFSGPDGAWGVVVRGTHGLTPEKLDGYLKMRVAEYSKGFDWLPKDSPLQWLKKEIVTSDGRKWADWRFVPMLKGTKDYSQSPVYTRFLTTSYKGQLLEINFTTNLNTDPKVKKEIDRIMDSVHLEE